MLVGASSKRRYKRVLTNGHDCCKVKQQRHRVPRTETGCQRRRSAHRSGPTHDGRPPWQEKARTASPTARGRQ
eukprot:64789-Prymnesium_polylepis.1